MSAPDGDSVMASEPAVVVPREAASTVDEREALAQLPSVPVAGQSKEVDDAVMAEAEDIREDLKEANEDAAQEAEADDADMGDDLFGDGEEDEDEDEAEQKGAPDVEGAQIDSALQTPQEGTPQLDEEELERRRRLEYEEDDEGPAVIEQKVQYAQVKLANIPLATETQKLWHARLPNFLHLETAPFTPTNWDPENEPSNVPVENTIRWRWDPKTATDQPKKQSNARMVRWNDGSLSLQIGSEFFDIATDKGITGKAIAPQSTLPSGGVSQQSARSSDSTTYLVAQHPYAGLLESQALVTGSLTFRPTTIQSASHRKIASTLSNQNKLGAKSKTVMMMASSDPEAERLAKEAELNRRGGKKTRAPRGEGAGAYRKGKRKSVRSTRLDDFSDAEGEEDFDDDADTELAAAKAARRRARAREEEDLEDFLAPESDEDEDEASSRRRGRDTTPEEDDDLDEMEARAERAAKAERNRKKKADGGSASASGTSKPPVDFDSDDLDEDEPTDGDAVVKKKLVIESDDDE